MIKRPEGLSYIKVDLVFNFRSFTELEIDLSHINKDDRSNLKVEEVVKLVEQLLKNTTLLPSDKKEFGEDTCSYFVKVGKYENKRYKLVFCICSDKPESIGVITLHRV